MVSERNPTPPRMVRPQGSMAVVTTIGVRRRLAQGHEAIQTPFPKVVSAVVQIHQDQVEASGLHQFDGLTWRVDGFCSKPLSQQQSKGCEDVVLSSLTRIRAFSTRLIFRGWVRSGDGG